MLYMHCVSLETTQRCLSKSILDEKNITTFFALVMVCIIPCTSWYDMTETLIKSSEIKQEQCYLLILISFTLMLRKNKLKTTKLKVW